MLLVQEEGETRAVVYRALMPCRGGCSGKTHRGSSCPGWSFSTGSHGAGGNGGHSQGLPSTVVQVVHTKGAPLVVPWMGSFELCSIQPTEGCVKPSHPSRLTERNSVTKRACCLVPQLREDWRCTHSAHSPQPAFFSFGVQTTTLKRSPDSGGTSFPINTRIWPSVKGHEGSPAPVFRAQVPFGWTSDSACVYLPVRIVLPQALAWLYCCLELF